MSLTALLTQQVTVVNPATTTDEYNNPILDYAGGTQVQFYGRLRQIREDEVTADRQAQVGDWVLILPPEAEGQISGISRVVGEGLTFEVIGPPRAARTPRGPHHVRAELRVVEG